MKLMVDIKKAVQEYDLDKGIQKNFLVFDLGGVTHTVEASEEQLQQAIYDARMAGQNGGHRAHVHDHYTQKRQASGPLTQHLASIEPEEEPEEHYSVKDIGAQLLAEGYTEGEVLQKLQEQFPEYFEDEDVGTSQPPPPEETHATLFEDFSGQPTPEEMAEFQAPQDQMPDSIDVSSDDLSEGGTLEAVITGPHGDPEDTVYKHPRTGKILSKAQYDHITKTLSKPHLAAQQSDRDKKAALRARAARVPKKSVASDDAGNPIAPQKMEAPPPVAQKTPTGPSLPGFDDDGFAPG